MSLSALAAVVESIVPAPPGGTIGMVGDPKLACALAPALAERCRVVLVAARGARWLGKRSRAAGALPLVAASAAVPFRAGALDGLLGLRALGGSTQPEALVGSWCRMLAPGAWLGIVETSTRGGVMGVMRRLGAESFEPHALSALLLNCGLGEIHQRRAGSYTVSSGVFSEATATRQGLALPG